MAQTTTIWLVEWYPVLDFLQAVEMPNEYMNVTLYTFWTSLVVFIWFGIPTFITEGKAALFAQRKVKSLMVEVL